MSAILLFRCVAKGVLKKALAELQSGQGFRQRLLDIANQTYGEFQKETRTVRYLEVLAAVALASPEESKHISAQVVEELRSDRAFKDLLEKPETVERLLGYLEQFPVSVRNRFRRPMDPTGRSLPQDFRLTRPEDLMVLLPPKAPQFRVGDQPVGNWRLVQLLGIGAFGEVWKAEDAMDGDSPDVPPVALKFCLSPESIRNLRHETGLLQRIEKHLGEMKGIVRLRKAWLEAEPPCLEYEYVNGGDLCGLMGEWLVQTPEKRATLALQMLHRLAKVIAPLHEMDPPIVHRDLKPANVLVSKGPNNKFDMKISDFGISGVAAGMALEGYAQSLSQSEILTSTLRGTHTPLYASPEQRAGAAPHPTDDVHALGVIGFQLLVCDLKRSPTSDWDEELRERGIGDEPIRILRKCLARKNNRYQSAGELRDVLYQFLDGSKPQIAAFGDSQLQPLPHRVEKTKSTSDPVMDVLLSYASEASNTHKINEEPRDTNSSKELKAPEKSFNANYQLSEKTSDFKSTSEKAWGHLLRILLLIMGSVVLSGIPIFLLGILMGKSSTIANQQVLQKTIDLLYLEIEKTDCKIQELSKDNARKNEAVIDLNNLTKAWQAKNFQTEELLREKLESIKNLETTIFLLEKKNKDFQNNLLQEKHNIQRGFTPQPTQPVDQDKKAVITGKESLLANIKTDQYLYGIAFSSDGEKLACGLGNTTGFGNSTINIYSTRTGDRIMDLTGHSGPVSSICFSNNGRYLASVGYDDTVKIWDIEKNKNIKTINLKKVKAALAFSKDDRFIAFKDEKSIFIYETNSWNKVKIIQSDFEMGNRILFGLNDRLVVVSNYGQDKPIEVFDNKQNKKIYSFLSPDQSYSYSNKILLFDSGNKLANEDINNITFWNLENGEKISSIRIGKHSSFAITFNGGQLAYGTWKQEKSHIAIVDFNKNTNFIFQAGTNSRINFLEYSPTGKILATGFDDGSIKLWNID